MFSIEIFIVLSFVTYRITNLFVEEYGPFFMFVRFRDFVGISYFDTNELAKNEFFTVKEIIELAYKNVDHTNYSIPYYRNVFAYMLSCFYCTSVWVAFGVVLVYSLTVEPLNLIEFLFNSLAISGTAILIESKI